MWKLIVLCLVYVCVAFGESICRDSNDAVARAMRNEGIKNDVVPDLPREFLEVIYKNGVKANLGNELTPTQVKDKPSIKWAGKENKYYTLVLTDPDVPSRVNSTDTEFCHWLVVNILGNNVGKGDELVEYVGSGPPQGTGLHRYVFLLYEQLEEINFNNETRINNRTAANRFNFSINTFSFKYQLGVPVAGNFYKAKYDDYVPVIHKQLQVNAAT